jgi:hypothetical protein
MKKEPWKNFERGRVSKENYETVRKWSARHCHDAIIYLPEKNEILLAVRKGAPARGATWPFGGGQKGGIPVKESLKKLIQGEIGLRLSEIEAINQEGPVDHFWKDGPYDGFDKGVHDVAMIYSGVGIGETTPDNLHDKALIGPNAYLNLREGLHPYVRSGMDVAVERFFELKIESPEPFPDFYIEGVPFSLEQ